MTALIPFSHANVDRYLVTLELATGKSITIDLFPLRVYLEKYFDDPQSRQLSVDIMNGVFKKIGITNPEIADHTLELIMVTLKHSAICS